MQELVVVQPGELMRQATDVAGVSRDIVLRTAIEIQGRRYVKVEGWQAIAIAHGCVLSATNVEQIEGGVRAIGEVRRIADGVLIATAEGFVGDDESMWQKRPMYARRAMVQTRAMSRAARTAFAHVVVMIDSGLSTTPAEEVPAEGFDNPPRPAASSPRPAQAQAQAQAQAEKTGPPKATVTAEQVAALLIPGEECPPDFWKLSNDLKQQAKKIAGVEIKKLGTAYMCLGKDAA